MIVSVSCVLAREHGDSCVIVPVSGSFVDNNVRLKPHKLYNRDYYIVTLKFIKRPQLAKLLSTSLSRGKNWGGMKDK